MEGRLRVIHFSGSAEWQQSNANVRHERISRDSTGQDRRFEMIHGISPGNAPVWRPQDHVSISNDETYPGAMDEKSPFERRDFTHARHGFR
jgi:hypothetical protein